MTSAQRDPQGTGPRGRAAGLAHDLRDEGVACVQLHGLTSSRRRDEVLGLDLTRGLVGARVLRYDARGHGLSGGPVGDPASYSWPSLAEDLTALLDAEFPGERVHGVGQSMGSATLLTAAVADPGRFRSLVLGIPPTAWRRRVAKARLYRRDAEAVREHGIEAFAEAGRHLAPPPAVSPDRPFTLPDVSPELLPDVFLGAALSDLPDPEVLARITVPTLVLAWPGDPAHPVSVAERLVEVLPDARLEVARTPAEAARWPRAVAGALGLDPGSGGDPTSAP